MYRIAICDDEQIFVRAHCEAVASVLSEAGVKHNIETFAGSEAIKLALAGQPDRFDVLLLDILLGAENGVDLARQLRAMQYRGGIVFVTSTRAYSLEGYSVYPIQYLLKPLDRDALREALLRDYERIGALPTLPVPVKGEHLMVSISDILYVESLLRFLIFHTKERAIESSRPLKDALEALRERGFAQCHKSYLVPVAQIRTMTRTKIQLKCGPVLPVGRVYYEDALSAFIEYMQRG